MTIVILFSDLHCNHKQLANLSDYLVKNENIQALVFTGDAVNMGEPVSFMEQFIKVIENVGKPFFWVPGNNDFGRAYHKLNARYKSLEGRVQKLTVISSHSESAVGRMNEGEKSLHIGNNGILKRVQDDALAVYRFTGVGGSPASWAGQYQGEKMVDQEKIAGSIFVSHYPPPANIKLFQFDVGSPKLAARNSKQIKSSNDQNSKQFKKLEHSDLEFVSNLEFSASNLPNEKRLGDAPLVHICGHLHYKWGTAFLGQTKIIQLASLETGYYAILDLDTLSVKFERF